MAEILNRIGPEARGDLRAELAESRAAGLVSGLARVLESAEFGPRDTDWPWLCTLDLIASGGAGLDLLGKGIAVRPVCRTAQLHLALGAGRNSEQPTTRAAAEVLLIGTQLGAKDATGALSALVTEGSHEFALAVWQVLQHMPSHAAQMAPVVLACSAKSELRAIWASTLEAWGLAVFGAAQREVLDAALDLFVASGDASLGRVLRSHPALLGDALLRRPEVAQSPSWPPDMRDVSSPDRVEDADVSARVRAVVRMADGRGARLLSDELRAGDLRSVVPLLACLAVPDEAGAALAARILAHGRVRLKGDLALLACQALRRPSTDCRMELLEVLRMSESKFASSELLRLARACFGQEEGGLLVAQWVVEQLVAARGYGELESLGRALRWPGARAHLAGALRYMREGRRDVLTAGDRLFAADCDPLVKVEWCLSRLALGGEGVLGGGGWDDAVDSVPTFLEPLVVQSLMDGATHHPALRESIAGLAKEEAPRPAVRIAAEVMRWLR